MKKFTLAGVAACALATTALAESPFRAGKWEVTTQMEMPGAPIALPATTNTRCVTGDDPERSLPGGSPDPGADCKVSNYKVAGKTVTWSVTCSGTEPMTGEGSIVVDGDRYDGTMKMTMSAGAMNMKYTGKRVGDCAP